MYLIGLCCALRGCGEHFNLRRDGCNSQFAVIQDEDGIECIRYIEDPLQKANQGGLNDDNPGHGKEVYIYASHNYKRDPVRLYKKYVSFQPKNVKPACSSFYLCPLRKPTPTCWYGDQAYGKKNVGCVVKSIMAKAKIKGRWTNHSLRRTASTRLLSAKVAEKVVKEITGHTSDCVRMYQKTCDSLKRDACKALYGQHPNKLVECTVTPPGRNPTDSETCQNIVSNNVIPLGSSADNVVVKPNVTKEEELIPIVTNENYKDENLPRVKCMSVHAGGKPEITRLCRIIKKKVNDKLGYDVYEKEYGQNIAARNALKSKSPDKTRSDKSVQVDFEHPTTQCKCVNRSTSNIAVQTDNAPIANTSKMSFDINFNFNVSNNS